jgi:hypothetical protein
MSSTETATRLRSVLDEVCGEVGRYENGTRAHVAAKLLEASACGEQTIEYLKQIGREALKGVPTMWR